jgi:hypothetical protein
VLAKSSASIIALDQLIQPNQSARLSVRLVTGGLSFVRRPISGERIEFMLKGRSLGQTLTGGDGLAVKNFIPSKPGLYVITARLVDNPRHEADAAELYVACRAGSVPILLVALSSVRTPIHPPAVPFGPAPELEAMADAVPVLSKLSDQYQLVYFESGDESLKPESREWLNSQDFPAAPLLVWSSPAGPDEGAERFAERLQEIRDNGWKNIRAGITRSAAEAEALTGMKIKTIVMAEEDEDLALPKGAKTTGNWKSIPSVVK